MSIHSAIKIAGLASLIFLATDAISQTQTNQTNGIFYSKPEPPNVKAIKPQDVKAVSPQEDAAIVRTLKNLIKESKILSKLKKVSVSSTNGVVVITGNVDSNTQAGSLVELAESIVGVSNVDTSQLKIRGSQQPLADTIITAKIKGLFIREKLFGEKDIAAINTSVETKNGVVYLSGIVDNQQQIDNAIDVIKRSVPEVKNVEYEIAKIIPNR